MLAIVIPNWNGKRLLEKNLPAVLAAGADEVIVSDDGSTDGSVEFLKEKFPQVKLVVHRRLGFPGNCNEGVKKAKGEIVILLNTDVIPRKDFLKPLEKDFKDPKVFAVSFNESNWSWAKIKWVNGFVEHKPGPKVKTIHLSAWASGGSAAFRKTMWEELGGFDEVYSPFYWEDIDLSYRAWKRGYKVLWEPRAIVHHKHEETIKRFSKKYINFISQRNQLLFIWKNISDSEMIREHKIGLLRTIVKNPGYFKVFLASLLKLPQILPKRFREKKEAKISDREIFGKFK